MKFREFGPSFYRQVLYPQIRKSGCYLNKNPFKPFRVNLTITEKCNLKCKQCHVWKKKCYAKPLTEKEMKKLILQLRQWLGPFNISFTGGEPFMEKELVFNLLDFAYQNDLTVDIVTNGTLINAKDAKRLSKINFLGFAVSLDAATPEAHNYLRGVPGTFQRVMNNVDLFDKDFIKNKLAISTTIMSYNADEIISLIKLMEEKGIATIGFQSLAPTFNTSFYPTWYENNALFPRTAKEKKKVLNLIDQLIDMKKNGGKITNSLHQLKLMRIYYNDPSSRLVKKCYQGAENFVVDVFGNVRLCFEMDPIGNVRDRTPWEIWNSPEALSARKKIRRCKRKCAFLFCNYSPTLKENLHNWYASGAKKAILDSYNKTKSKLQRKLGALIWINRKNMSNNSTTLHTHSFKKAFVYKKPEFVERIIKRHAIDIARFEKFLDKKHPDLVDRYVKLCRLFGPYFGKRVLIATHYGRLGGCVY